VARHIARVPVRWADLDALGHVNNVVYLRYLQEARVDMLFVNARQNGAKGLADGVVVASHDIEYLAPLRFRAEPVLVETWVTDVRHAWFTLAYEVYSADPGTGQEAVLCATAASKLVPYDFATKRPRRLTDVEKTVLEGFRE
jgi:acyl-CoA thioester hydrolase